MPLGRDRRPCRSAGDQRRSSYRKSLFLSLALALALALALLHLPSPCPRAPSPPRTLAPTHFLASLFLQ